MSSNTIWKVKSNPVLDTLTLPKILSILLSNRGLKRESEISDFLQPDISKFQEMSFEDMEKTIKRIEKAINKKEKITVYSDYDADGISAAAILWETINSLGGKVLPYIPNRLTEGYGFSKTAIKSLASSGVSLIISVDHGITAKEEIDYAQSLGVDVILTDHHLPPANLPEPFSKIHTTLVCGAAVSWRLSYELHKHFEIPLDEINEKLSIASIATIADQMPLTGHNRAIVKYGLEHLRTTKRPGLLELFNISALRPSSIDEYHLGHVIAPRINAMGRLESAVDSLRLYCTTSSAKAKELAKILENTNIKRQELTSSGVLEAYSEVNDKENLLILNSPNWHEGIIGLIAGRINDKYSKPTIVISVGEKFSKGSARSVDGVDITALLRKAGEGLLEDVGGHTMAAGFTIETRNIAKLKKSLLKEFDKKYLNNIFTKELLVETEILPHHISLDLLQLTQKLKPFGNSNPEPVFLVRKIKVLALKKVGSDQSHIKIDFENISGIGFRLAEKAAGIRPGDAVDIIFTLNINEFNGRKSLQLIVNDIVLTGDQNILRA